MPLGNFINTVLIANLMRALEKAHVFASVANRNYEGQLQNLGDKVRILQISDPTIKAYTKNADIAAPEEIADAVAELIADQANYFNVAVDDAEATQSKSAIKGMIEQKAAYKLRDVVDQYFAGLYAQAGITLGTNDAPKDVTSLNVEDVLAESAELMDDNKIPRENRFLIIPPWFHTKLFLAGLTTKTQNDVLLANGIVDKVAGFDLRMSTNVSKNSTAWDKSRLIGGIIGESLSYAEVINKVEAYRPEKRFADAIKGLHIFGGKVMRPDMTLCIYADKTDEAA